MDLNTIFQLQIDCETVVNEGDKISINFKTGEVLHSTYQNSDFSSLTLERNNDEFIIDFDEIESVDILERAN